MKITKDGSVQWSKKDWEKLMFWKAKKLGLTIKKSRGMIEIQKKKMTLLGLEDHETWTDHVSRFLEGYQWGYNFVIPQNKRVYYGFHNYPPYLKAKKDLAKRKKT